MPELPEVETMRRGIARIVGSRIGRMACPRSRLQSILIVPPVPEFRRRVVGKKIVGVGRAGKRVVVELDSADRIVFEPRMTGRVLLADPPDRLHLRVVFELEDGPAPRLIFWDVRGLGVVRLVTPDEFDRQLGAEKLGPDALEISLEALCERLGSSRRAIKAALLDQRALAGIGNLYASEILHRAKLHPLIPCNRLRLVDWTRLHRSIREVLEEAVRCQGSTLADGNYRDAQNRPGAYQERHLAYQRAGQPCLQCGRGRIVRIVQAQRSTFFCPRCQAPRQGRRPTSGARTTCSPATAPARPSCFPAWAGS